MESQETIGGRAHPLRTSALPERHRRLVPRAPPKGRRCSRADRGCAYDNEGIAREGGLLHGERAQSAGRARRSREELGSDGRGLQYVLSEGSAGAVLFRKYGISPGGPVTPDRLYCVRGLKL